MSYRFPALLALGALLGPLGAPVVHSADRASNLGRKVAHFTLKDPRSQKSVSLDDFKDRKAVVVLFLGTECPINNAYLPGLAELSKEYAAKGVQFLAINANSQDSTAQVAAHARKFGVPFPVLKDEGNVVADQLGALRTPEAFVLDAERAIRYQGRIDDRIGVGYQRPKATRRYLAEALDEVLAGKAVAQPTTPVPGCLIGRVLQPKAEGPVTYGKQVARVLQKNCQECHRPGQIAPMPLLTYDDAVSWSATIKEVIEENRMPPWYADPRYGKFHNDRRLSAEEKNTLLAWIEAGCPKGDDKDLPPPRHFVAGWSIGQPDVVLTMEEAYHVPAEAPRGGIPYQYFSVDTNFKEDRWVVSAESKPGAAEVVHHIIVFIVPPGKVLLPGQPGQVLCGTAPGDTALRLPPGTAKKIPAGSRLLFQLHYTPNGTPQQDRSSVGLIFAKTPPERESLTASIGNHGLRIPPGADNHPVESRFTFKQDGYILGFMPHMHWRGKDFRYEVIFPDGKKETLLLVPRYNFNWQNSYRLAEPQAVPKGTVVHCLAHFDNSARNPNNPDPTREVRWGDQVWEEMMIGWMEFAYNGK